MRASVLIPTHDHAGTLPVAVASALDQTVTDVEVMIVGDGVTAPVRAVAEQLARRDPRIVFLDLPKGPHHGEVHRDRAIRHARSDAIFYLCDDDLLLPRHVENLLALLDDADLVQCRNCWIDDTGQLRLHPTDLADPRAIAWHLREPRRNATSLTGTAHTRGAYLTLDPGWTTTPPGQWPDHHLWKQFFRARGFRGATHPEVTALQWPTSMGRASWDQQRRLAEQAWWRDRVAAADGDRWLADRVATATAEQLEQTHRDATDAALRIVQLTAEVGRLADEAARLRQCADEAEIQSQAQVRALAEAQAQYQAQARALAEANAKSLAVAQTLRDQARRLAQQRDALIDSRSWRLTRPLRGAARWIRRDGRAEAAVSTSAPLASSR